MRLLRRDVVDDVSARSSCKLDSGSNIILFTKKIFMSTLIRIQPRLVSVLWFLSKSEHNSVIFKELNGDRCFGQ